MWLSGRECVGGVKWRMLLAGDVVGEDAAGWEGDLVGGGWAGTVPRVLGTVPAQLLQMKTNSSSGTSELQRHLGLANRT